MFLENSLSILKKHMRRETAFINNSGIHTTFAYQNISPRLEHDTWSDKWPLRQTVGGVVTASKTWLNASAVGKSYKITRQNVLIHHHHQPFRWLPRQCERWVFDMLNLSDRANQIAKLPLRPKHNASVAKFFIKISPFVCTRSCNAHITCSSEHSVVRDSYSLVNSKIIVCWLWFFKLF